MAMLSLWKTTKNKDFNFADNLIRQHFNIGGTGLHVHKYIGPKIDKSGNTDTDITTIQDVLFLENRNRKYDQTVFELVGHYQPKDSEFDLTEFGLFLSSDNIAITLHTNDMIARLGRSLIIGDVIELPHLKEDTIPDPDKGPVLKYYVVDDSMRWASGYGPSWYNHIWIVKLKPIFDSEEYKDIIKNETSECDACDGTEQSNTNNLLDLTDKLVEEAKEHVLYDPKFFDSSHLWVTFDSAGHPLLNWHSSTSEPPNGSPLSGEGDSFPDTLQNGDYFLRTDFNPNRLFMKDGNKFIKIGDDLRKPWTPTNTVLDTYINNEDKTSLQDGSQIDTRQALSKVVKPRTKRNNK